MEIYPGHLGFFVAVSEGEFDGFVDHLDVQLLRGAALVCDVVGHGETVMGVDLHAILDVAGIHPACFSLIAGGVDSGWVGISVAGTDEISLQALVSNHSSHHPGLRHTL